MNRICHLGLASLVLALTFSGGCSSSKTAENDSESGDKSLRIAVIPKGTSHEFWKSVHFGAQKAATELGNVRIIWRGLVSTRLNGGG